VGMGDLVVNVSVYVPKELSRSEKQSLEQFKDSDNFKGDNFNKEINFLISSKIILIKK
jgi:molecular chaperone DnaJ